MTIEKFFVGILLPGICLLTHLKRPWCWERLKVGGKGDNRGWDGWMPSPTQWTWVWVNSTGWWWRGRPGVLQSVGLQRVRCDWATELTDGWSAKESSCMQETWVWSLGQADPLEEEMQPTPVFVPGKFHGQRNLVGYSPWSCKKAGQDWSTNTATLVLYVIIFFPSKNKI